MCFGCTGWSGWHVFSGVFVRKKTLKNGSVRKRSVLCGKSRRIYAKKCKQYALPCPGYRVVRPERRLPHRGHRVKDVGGGLRAYYVLQPVFEESATIFVPVGNEALTAKMRRVMSEAEITALIDAMPEEDSIWIADDNARRERYKAILAGGDPSDLIRLIKTLYLRAQTQKAQNKKPRLEDERFMKQAEKLLYEEFAHVLHIRRDEVLPYILHRVNGSTPS